MSEIKANGSSVMTAKASKFVYVFFFKGKTSKYGRWITSHMAFDADKRIANAQEVKSLVLYIKNKLKFYDIHLTSITIL